MWYLRIYLIGEGHCSTLYFIGEEQWVWMMSTWTNENELYTFPLNIFLSASFWKSAASASFLLTDTTPDNYWSRLVTDLQCCQRFPIDRAAGLIWTNLTVIIKTFHSNNGFFWFHRVGLQNFIILFEKKTVWQTNPDQFHRTWNDSIERVSLLKHCSIDFIFWNATISTLV